jgi:hypothetical protein
MPTYNVSLVRSYKVTIQAENSNQAARFAEFFIGYEDISTEQDKDQFNFVIDDIEMTQNDTVEVSSLE